MLLEKRIKRLENKIIPDNSVYELYVNPDPEKCKWYKVEDGKRIELSRPPIIKGEPDISIHLVGD